MGTKTLLIAAVAFTFALPISALAKDHPLPSWKNSDSRAAIITFVETVTDTSSENYVPPADRIATFDNDGTLWTEHPVYTQLAYVLDRVKTLAPKNPEWKSKQPFKAVLEGDMKAVGAAGEKGLVELMMATHAGMSTVEFELIISDWFQTARHPRFKRPYTELTYKPMVELLEYLRENEFITYIVSGGGVEFMRPMTMDTYGIPPQQVIGSSIKTEYKVVNGAPTLIRLPEINFNNDKGGKPVAINQFIGKRPIASFGNSGGDQQMLEWTGAGDGARLMMLVFHDDAEREYAYGPANGQADTHFGRFPQSLVEQADKQGWHIISMKNDWATIFTPVAD
ncbi:HAD family hydrolase [Marinobacter sp. DY40_1A1]|uniref:HAD family hydrolase n=1 Tax=Marinobacter sp. DY40_1A1 TaxID=2583229 RepID=UPI00190666F7|nr:HAD family hydrolase [Marinobacter sp. DY40_1A1]MBK1886078.1 haloacid dehalogenase-like hydrolase [Marinobacter sp. DY40_1A1]